MSHEVAGQIQTPTDLPETMLATAQNEYGSMSLQPVDPKLNLYSTTTASAEVTNVHIEDNPRAFMGAQGLLYNLKKQAHDQGIEELVFTSRNADPTVIKFWNQVLGKPVGMADDYPGINEGTYIWRQELVKPEEINTAQIIDLIHAALPDIDTTRAVLGETEGDILAPSFEALLADPTNTVRTIEDENGVHVAFTIAVPIGKMDRTRTSESAETAYAYLTAVDPAFQHMGLVGTLMKDLHSALLDKGYRYMERDVITETGTGYAANISKNYGNAIVEEKQQTKWEALGEQHSFRIDLTKLP